jgi:hypothetical protein
MALRPQDAQANGQNGDSLDDIDNGNNAKSPARIQFQ